ncbi:hypothetical protein CYMTET_32496 [Cymbomonas tetramitiformis]|uniref:Uncharacterized protein n=1 Tax=Cymbomonas tetramitiformis TaxID=36881 RepID=A0AAE0FEM5_9CHLO|nr:hypothetical protein CYMTET_32496 [Cymbomonas tetramitiformis]
MGLPCFTATGMVAPAPRRWARCTARRECRAVFSPWGLTDQRVGAGVDYISFLRGGRLWQPSVWLSVQPAFILLAYLLSILCVGIAWVAAVYAERMRDEHQYQQRQLRDRRDLGDVWVMFIAFILVEHSAPRASAAAPGVCGAAAFGSGGVDIPTDSIPADFVNNDFNIWNSIYQSTYHFTQYSI